jgi:hypothetical protein
LLPSLLLLLLPLLLPLMALQLLGWRRPPPLHRECPQRHLLGLHSRQHIHCQQLLPELCGC